MVTGGHDGGGAAGDPAFMADALAGLLLTEARAVFDFAKGVEHDDVGDTEFTREVAAGPAALPVVAVDRVVAAPVLVHKAAHVPRKLRQMVGDGVLVDRLGGAGVDTHEPQVLGDLLNPGQVGVSPRENVDFEAQPCQLSRKFEHVDVHPARFAPTERRERTGVGGDLGDAHGHSVIRGTRVFRAVLHSPLPSGERRRAVLLYLRAG